MRTAYIIRTESATVCLVALAATHKHLAHRARQTELPCAAARPWSHRPDQPIQTVCRAMRGVTTSTALARYAHLQWLTDWFAERLAQSDAIESLLVLLFIIKLMARRYASHNGATTPAQPANAHMSMALQSSIPESPTPQLPSMSHWLIQNAYRGTRNSIFHMAKKCEEWTCAHYARRFRYLICVPDCASCARAKYIEDGTSDKIYTLYNKHLLINHPTWRYYKCGAAFFFLSVLLFDWHSACVSTLQHSYETHTVEVEERIESSSNLSMKDCCWRIDGLQLATVASNSLQVLFDLALFIFWISRIRQ